MLSFELMPLTKTFAMLLGLSAANSVAARSPPPLLGLRVELPPAAPPAAPPDITSTPARFARALAPLTLMIARSLLFTPVNVSPLFVQTAPLETLILLAVDEPSETWND